MELPTDLPPAIAGPGLYLANEDNLRITLINSLAGARVTISGRRLGLGSDRIDAFRYEVTPASDRSASTFVFRLGAGWLLNVQAFVSNGSPVIGQTFAIVQVVRGQSGDVIDLATLLAGYVTARQRIGWPGGTIEGSLEGAGALRKIAGTTPAAGAELNESVPTGARWMLLSLKLLLTTSAVAGNRQITLTFDDGTNFYLVSGQGNTTPASTAQTYYWMHGGLPLVSGSLQGRVQGFPPTMWMLAGHRFNTSTAALDVGDQYSAIHYVVREWLEGN